MDLKRNRSGAFAFATALAVRSRPTQGIIGALLALILSVSGASAATLNVVGGQLLGATGVVVDGSSYNVVFLDGTCINLYDGCDDVADFTFQTGAAALLASQALLDQVFVNDVHGVPAAVPTRSP